jgi:putative membrane protein
METSLERKRIRGLEHRQSILVRLAHAGSIQAIVSGMAASGSGDPGKAPLTPLAPNTVCEGVAGQVLGTGAPFNLALTKHGRRAARRRWTRVALTHGPVAIAGAGAVAYFHLWPGLYAIPALLVALGIFLAIDRYRRLGHGYVDDHLVVASGSVVHVRTLLDQDAIIGWNFEQSFFQRRLGITTLLATIAAGDSAATALDIDEQAATALAIQATPGLLEPFLAE